MSLAANIPHAVLEACRRYGHRDAVREAGETVTYTSLGEKVVQAAEGVIAAGVDPGDCVALWAPNSLAWAVAALGVHAAGGVLVPLSTRSPVGEAAEMVRRSRSRLVLSCESFLGRSLRAEMAESGLSADVVELGDWRCGQRPRWVEGAPAAAAEVERRMGDLRPGSASHLQFTSGTTGHPRAVILRHGPMVRTTQVWGETVGLGPGWQYPVVAPFAHLGGHKTGLLAALLSGATLLPVPVMDLDSLLAVLNANERLVMQGPPTMFRAMVERYREGEQARPALEVAVTGGTTVPVSSVHDIVDVLGARTVINAYGLTEATGVCTMTHPDDPPRVVAETSGRPIHGVEVRISEPDVAGRGEVLVRGDNVMAGYFDDPSATEAAVVDGWLHTGDLGVIDAEGNLRVVDRLKDMVVVGGFNAAPAEIERVLCNHPAVSSAAVVGAPDERLGEVPVAFVVGSEAVPPDALVTHCRERLANYKVPRAVWWVDQLPLSATGKVLKQPLRRTACDRMAGSSESRPPVTGS